MQWHQVEFDKSTGTWLINGQKLDESKTCHIAASDYLSQGREDRLAFFKPTIFIRWETAKEGDGEDLRSDTRKAVVAYMEVNCK